MKNQITNFKKNEFKFLSNFYPATVTYNGIKFATVEHAFQAAKADNQSLQELFSIASTPAEARRLGRSIPLRADWEDVKISIMEDLLRQKFSIPELKQKLSDTKNAEILEENTHNDRYWGTVNGSGSNMLGKLIMKIREEL